MLVFAPIDPRHDRWPMSIFRTDIWRTGVVRAPIAAIRDVGSLAPFSIRWLPNPGSFRFLADPFGLWRDGKLHVFVEHYDYRTRKGIINLLILNGNLDVLEQGTVLSEPWHLSYPFVFEAEGETWMLPEAHRSGRLTLYRARRFPWIWEPVPEFLFPCAAIDATPVRVKDGWWMFYAPPFPKTERTTALRMARADSLTGPWEDMFPLSVRRDVGSGRLGGTPIVEKDSMTLPMQDCRDTYGGAVQLLRLSLPLADRPSFTMGPRLTAPLSASPFVEGMHTLSGAGDVTLIDTKQIVRNASRRLLMDVRHRLSRI